MSFFAIGDLHMSSCADKPMDIFGMQWTNHLERIMNNWVSVVKETDYVLIPGDISWAMKPEYAWADLDILEQLPGKKICTRGNHDYWWDRPAKFNDHYHKLYLLQNTAYILQNTAICGSRGWLCPTSPGFNKEDEKILKRELIRLQLSLDDAVKKRADEIIVMLHYPPGTQTHPQSPFTELIEKYPATHVVYGHLHDEISWQDTIQGEHHGIHYQLVSADFLQFSPSILINF